MPERTKKDRKNDHPTGSRWHTFHFSGKLILCSVIFGLLLILVGGIVLAIGMDRDDQTKSDDYDDLQKKPPLASVGIVIMGIGGFAVVVGILMCLVETKVFRRRSADASPLIGSEGGETAVKETDPAAIPSTSRQHENNRRGNRKKSPSPRRTKTGKKSHSSKSHSPKTSPKPPSSVPIGINGNESQNFLSASDKFLTPPDSFARENMQLQANSQDAVNQTSSSIMKSFTSSGASWNISTESEFQTPPGSFNDKLKSLQSSQESNETPSPQSVMSIPSTPIVIALQNEKHEFVTPMNSNADILESSSEEESSDQVQHAFVTPKNSNADVLESSQDSNETLDQEANGGNIASDVNTGETTLSDCSNIPVETAAVDSTHEIAKQESPKVYNILDSIPSSDSKFQEANERSNANVLIHSASNDIESSIDPTEQKDSDHAVSKPPLNPELGKNAEANAVESEQKEDEVMEKESSDALQGENKTDNALNDETKNMSINYDVGNTMLHNIEKRNTDGAGDITLKESEASKKEDTESMSSNKNCEGNEKSKSENKTTTEPDNSLSNETMKTE